MQSRSQWLESSEMWTQYIVKYTEHSIIPTLKLEPQKHMNNKKKINWDHEINNISVCTKFQKFILINEVINAEQGFKLLSQGTQS